MGFSFQLNEAQPRFLEVTLKLTSNEPTKLPQGHWPGAESWNFRGTCLNILYSSRVCCDESARLHVYIYNCYYVNIYKYIRYLMMTIIIIFIFICLHRKPLPVMIFNDLNINHPKMLPSFGPLGLPAWNTKRCTKGVTTFPVEFNPNVASTNAKVLRTCQVFPPVSGGPGFCWCLAGKRRGKTPENEHRTQTCRFGRWCFLFSIGWFFGFHVNFQGCKRNKICWHLSIQGLQVWSNRWHTRSVDHRSHVLFGWFWGGNVTMTSMTIVQVTCGPKLASSIPEGWRITMVPYIVHRCRTPTRGNPIKWMTMGVDSILKKLIDGGSRMIFCTNMHGYWILN